MTFLLLLIAYAVNKSNQEEIAIPEPVSPPVFVGTLPDIPVQYVGKVMLGTMSVRLLVLKHCPDSIADVDAGQAVKAANLAKVKGLSIRDIGNYRIDGDGRTDRAMQWMTVPLDGLKKFVSDQMKVQAEAGDTLVLYTIGHGGGDGGLMRLGQRGPVMKIFAEAAEENEQKTLWWQLSCHAAAKLPEITTLTLRQREFFSMTASSPASEVSYFNTQGAQFEKVFAALAERSKEIDPNQDGAVVSRELKDFLNRSVKSGRGDLFWAADPEMVIFGWPDIANRIPIRDPDGSQKQPPEKYIPSPLKY
jgi:hypothetical protein